MRVHQVMVGASPGDAVTNIAYAIDDLLSPLVDTSLWALHLDHRCSPRVGSVAHMHEHFSGEPDDVIIYHSSIGEPRLTEMVLRRPERLVLHYHNITPARYFKEVDTGFARLLSSGRDEMRTLASRAELVLADSSYNAEEVRAISSVEIRVTPPPVDHRALVSVDAHELTLRHFREAVPGPLIVHVGQLLPHKRPDVLVAAMHMLTVELRLPAHLALIGPKRNGDYAWAMQSYIEDLGLTNVWLAGERSDEELAAYFRSASVFATATEHEGFCLPVVEAFAFDLPVVARRAAAIPETVGAGGVLLPGDAGPALFAEAFARLLTDEPLRQRFAQGGAAQLERFSLERSRKTMLEALLEVVPA